MASVTLVLGEKSQSVSGNYTDVSWSLRLYVWNAVNANMTGNAVIDGTTVYTHSGNPGYIPMNTTKTIASGTHRVYHSSDGTKSINWSATLRTNTQGNSWSFNESNSGSRTLSRIPRTSGATLSSNSVQMGGSVNVGFQRASSSFTHSVRLTFGDYLNEAFTRSSATSVTLNIPAASVLAKEIPDATSGIGHVRVTTFSGTTSIGSVTLPITITLPSSVTPSVGTITITDTTNFHTLAGDFVQGRSRPRVNVSGSSGVYGSTIRSSVVNLGNRNLGSPGSTFTVPSAGTYNLSVTVRDSRGRKATKSFGNVTVLGYSAPVANVTAKRANSNNGDNPYGTYLKFEGTTSVHDITLKGVANRRTVSVTRAVSGSSSTTSLYSLSASTIKSGAIPSPLGANAILVTNSYDVVVTVTDSLGISTVKRIAIPSGQVSLSVGKTGIGAGKIWEQGALDVGGDAYVSGNLDVSGSLKFGIHNLTTQNLNDITRGGFYRQGNSAYATTARNYPTLVAGLLEVFESSNMIWQRYTRYNNAGYSAGVYNRRKYNDIWYDWEGTALYENYRESLPDPNSTWSGGLSYYQVKNGWGFLSVDIQRKGTALENYASFDAWNIPASISPANNIFTGISNHNRNGWGALIVIGSTGAISFHNVYASNNQRIRGFFSWPLG